MSSRNRRTPVIIDVKRLASYAIAGTAAVGVNAKMAEADIHYFSIDVLLEDTSEDPPSAAHLLSFAATGVGASWHFGFVHDLGSDNNPATGRALTAGNLYGVGNAAQFAGAVVGAYNYVARLAFDADVNGQAFVGGAAAYGKMAYNAGSANDKFLPPGEGFIGIKFNTDQFGWIRVNMNGAPLNSFTIVDLAYADSGETIKAGQVTAVPEPATLSLLALGSVGIVAWRRRRAAKMTSAA